MFSRFVYSGIILTILILGLALQIFSPTPLVQLRNLVFDAYQRLAPSPYNGQIPVRIIDIDETSLRKIGQWPWPRNTLAQLVNRLNEMGASVIGLDIVLSEPDRYAPDQIKRFLRSPAIDQDPSRRQNQRDLLQLLPNPDQILAKQFERSSVITGFIANKAHGASKQSLAQPFAGFAFAGDDPKAFLPAYSAHTQTLPILRAKAKGEGALNWIPDYDQIIRRLPMMVQVNGQIYPSFAAEALRVAQGAASYIIKSSSASGVESFGAKSGINTIKIGAFEIPTDPHGQLWLKFTPANKARYIPAWKILERQAEAQKIEGHIVLIGTSATGLFDLRSTPLEASVPGVEIHAQAIEQILRGDYLHRPDIMIALELTLSVLLAVLLGAVIYFTSALWGALATSALLALLGGASWYAYQEMNILLDALFPGLLLISVYMFSTLFVYFRAEKQRKYVRQAFEHYMAPSMVDALARNPSRLQLGGETRDITVMFCDIRGFAGLSEGLDAQELTGLINRIFTPLSAAILKNQGTIDKYIGDAIMAFWNAPLDDGEHARHACQAAIQLQQAIAQLNREEELLRNDNDIAQKNSGQKLRLGIGVNSGPCCVGNLGSQLRYDYSAIGDNVNIASRLETLTKTYGAPIIAGQSTVLAAPDFAFLEIDTASLKGKAEKVKIFALLGDEKTAQTEAFKKLKTHHIAMKQALEKGNYAEAKAELTQCWHENWPELKALFFYYGKKIQAAQSKLGA